MVSDFHAYERGLAVTGLIPLLRARGIDPSHKRVLDVGCGYGGTLAALAEAFPLDGALGLDVDAAMIAAGAGRCPPEVRLEARDFFAFDGGPFDLILMRDVLEHIPQAGRALAKAASLLAPGGALFVSFAPFYSPFGGHQHNGAGPFAYVPWLHLLPGKWFRALLRLDGNSYKAGKGLADDMESVLGTRLTLRRFAGLARAAGLRPTYYARYLSRPDYRLKFGIPAIPFPPVPFLDEIACTGMEAILENGP